MRQVVRDLVEPIFGDLAQLAADLIPLVIAVVCLGVAVQLVRVWLAKALGDGNPSYHADREWK